MEISSGPFARCNQIDRQMVLGPKLFIWRIV